MRHLVLESCIIRPPSDFKGFDRLVTLSLWKVTISSTFLESLISHSPLLENLDILSVTLERLSLWEEPDFSVNAGESGSDISKFFEPFPLIENIRLNHNIFKFLAAGAGVPTKLRYDFNRLTRLCLHEICLSQLDEVSCAFCLIRSSLHLQHLKIQVFNDDDSEIRTLDSLEGFADETFNHLRTVELEDVIGTKLEMQLIELLLAKSPMLVRMQIKYGEEDNTPQKRLEVATEISRFCCALTEAEVVYNADRSPV